MKKQLILITVATFCFAVAPAFAQNPHGGGAGNAGGSHGPAMSKGNADHGNAGASSKGAASSSPTDLLTENTKLDSHLTSKLQSKGSRHNQRRCLKIPTPSSNPVGSRAHRPLPRYVRRGIGPTSQTRWLPPRCGP